MKKAAGFRVEECRKFPVLVEGETIPAALTIQTAGLRKKLQ
jgi:hypothetical protein